jgi:hypothetical protein
MTSEIAKTKTGESSLVGRPRREFSYFISPDEKMFQIVVKMKGEPLSFSLNCHNAPRTYLIRRAWELARPT